MQNLTLFHISAKPICKGTNFQRIKTTKSPSSHEDGRSDFGLLIFEHPPVKIFICPL